MCKNLYENLFSWLVLQMNSRLDSPSFTQQTIKSISILDIFGFEVLSVNSFEQLCINYANESLQQLYIQHAFKAEVTEF